MSVVVVAIAITAVFVVCSRAAPTQLVVLPTDHFSDEVSNALSNATAQDYEILLSAGNYSGCGPSSIDLKAGAALSVTIIGAGENETTIDCQSVILMSPVFICGLGCTGGLQDLTVRSVAMDNTSPANIGGVLDVRDGSTVAITRVAIELCSIVVDNYGIAFDLDGASSVIRVSELGTGLTVTNSSFVSNTAGVGVISIKAFATLHVVGSDFNENLATSFSTDGGGLGGSLSFSDGAIGVVARSSFFGGSSDRGGVVYAAYASHVTFENVETAQTFAGIFGGVFFMHYDCSLTIVNTSTSASTAGVGGVISASAGSVATVSSSSLSDSRADSGGAMHLHLRSTLTLLSVQIHGSKAIAGGVLAVLYDCDVFFVSVHIGGSQSNADGGVVFALGNLVNVNFDQVCVQDSESSGTGGVLSLHDSVNIVISDSVFLRSHASISGGVAYVGMRCDLLLKNVTVNETELTGGEFRFVVRGDSFTASNCWLASSSSGVIYAYPFSLLDTLTVELDSCVLSSGGQAVTVSLEGVGALGLMSDSVFMVDAGTGLALMDDSYLSVTNCTFIVRSAGGVGLYFVLSLPDVHNATLFVSGGTGMVMNAATPLSVSHGTWLVEGGGSALDSLSSLVLLSHCSFKLESGSALTALSSVVMVSYSTMDVKSGLAVSLTSSTADISYSSFNVSGDGYPVLCLFSTVDISHSFIVSQGASLVFALSDSTLDTAVILSELSSSVLSSGTSLVVKSCILVGSRPLSFIGPTVISDSFLGATFPVSPALVCSDATTLNHTVSCGLDGEGTSPVGSCAGGTNSLGAGLSNCHDACFSSDYCIASSLHTGPDGSDQAGWFDSMGCPRCAGSCWLGTNNCNESSAYCFDSDSSGGYTCECRTGYLGDGIDCQDIDECALSAQACLGPFTECLNTPGSFTCPCTVGFDAGDQGCEDVNECTLSLDNCGLGAVCLNTVGSFHCECSLNMYGNGTDECRACPAGASTEGQGATQLTDCLCPPNFFLNLTDCSACPQHSFSARGSMAVSDCFCEPFFYRAAGEAPETSCEVCPPGHYVPSPFRCLVCPSGMYSVNTNASSCLACPSGSNTRLEVGSTGCVCLDNYNSSDSGDGLTCTQSCPPGWQTAGMSCQMCGVGFFSQDVNSPRCTRCPVGTSTERANASSVSECECLPGRLADSGGGGEAGACPLMCPPGLVYVSGLDECVPCARGTYWSAGQSAGSGSCEVCPPNSYTNDDGAVNVTACLCQSGFAYDERRGWCAIQCGPGFAVQASSCELCGPGTYSSEANSLACSLCPANALTAPGAVSRGACACTAGFYLEASTGECEDCPKGASCAGGSAPSVAIEGYFETEQGTFVKCTPDLACEGMNKCSEGYEGPLCAACSEGHFRLDGYCRVCSGSKSAFAAVALAALLLAAAALIVYNLGEERASESAQASFGGLLIAFHSFQIIAMFGQLEVAWPPLFRQFLAALSLFFNFNVEVVGIECFSGHRSGSDGGGRHEGAHESDIESESVSGGRSSHPFVGNWLVGILSPFYVAVGLALAYFLLIFLHRCTPYAPTLRGYSGSKLVERLRRSASVSFVQALLLLYFPLTVNVFEAFQCVDNGTGVRVLASSRDIVCGGRVHSLLVGLSVATTLVYVVGMPALLLCLLYRLKATSSQADFYQKADVVVGKYRVSVYWYEGVVLLRRAAVAAVLLLLTPSPYVRAAAGAAVLLAAFVLNRLVSPYQLAWHNWVECSSLLSTVIFLEVGIAMQGTEWSETAKVLVASLSLLAALAIVLGAACYELWWAQRIWRGLASDGAVVSNYGIRSAAKHQVEVPVEPNDLFTVGALNEGEPRELVAVVPSHPVGVPLSQTFVVPFVPMPPPLNDDDRGVDEARAASLSVTTVTSLDVPPPPPFMSGGSGDYVH